MFSELPKLHIFFLPFMAHGHMIPTLDMAKLFASRGARSTIITTHLNAKNLEKPIEMFKNRKPGLEIDIKILDFSSIELGLPEGCENTDFLISNYHADASDWVLRFIFSTKLLKERLEQLIETTRPDCLVADMFFPWATEAAAKFGVPRLVFHGTCYFSLCATSCVALHQPHKKVASGSEPFVIPDLPGDIVITAEQISVADEETEMGKFMKEVMDSEKNSFGVLMNSFYELEPAYADFHRNILGSRSWHIGPLSLCNGSFEEKAERGQKAIIDGTECLKWLDSKKPNSVIYLSFGSMACLTNTQLTEIAAGLDGSGQDFLWVVRKDDVKDEEEEWLPKGFKKRTEGKGLIIRGWAPQVLILDHQAIGGFLTHCGWNSVLEGLVSGLPMVTWPMGAEQFYNEKLVTQVLKTGVSVGARKWMHLVGDFIGRDKVLKAVREVMVGEEAEEIRRRAKELGAMAKAAVREGGSSYIELNRFMEELILLRTNKGKDEQ